MSIRRQQACTDNCAVLLPLYLCLTVCFLPVFKCIQACSLTLVVLRCYISHAGSSMGASLYRDNHNGDPEVPVDGHVL